MSTQATVEPCWSNMSVKQLREWLAPHGAMHRHSMVRRELEEACHEIWERYVAGTKMRLDDWPRRLRDQECERTRKRIDDLYDMPVDVPDPEPDGPVEPIDGELWFMLSPRERAKYAADIGRTA